MYSLTRKYVLRKIIVFLILPGSLIASVQSNLEVIDSLFVGYFAGKMAHSTSAVDSVSILCNLKDKIVQSYVLQTIGNMLHQDSIVVFRNYNSNLAFEGIVIDIKEVIPEVTYSAPFNKSPLDEACVRRMVTLGINGQIYDTRNGQIKNALNEQLLFEDEVPRAQLEEIEKSPYDFTVGIRAFTSKWESYFEPVLVVSAIGVIIFLFFSQRF
jgi:hypothetical protein